MNVTIENIESKIKKGTSELLNLAKKTCWNNISSNCEYIISEIKPNDERNIFKQRKHRKLKNDKKTSKSLAEIIPEIETIFQNIYDLNLFIYKSKKDKTYIDIRYYLKSNLNQKQLKLVKNNEPMFHLKIAIPPYLKNVSEKFDVNWELGGIRYKWNMFKCKIKYKGLKY